MRKRQEGCSRRLKDKGFPYMAKEWAQADRLSKLTTERLQFWDQILNHKHQITNKSQITSTMPKAGKDQNRLLFGILVIVICLLFAICYLEFISYSSGDIFILMAIGAAAIFYVILLSSLFPQGHSHDRPLPGSCFCTRQRVCPRPGLFLDPRENLPHIRPGQGQFQKSQRF